MAISLGDVWMYSPDSTYLVSPTTILDSGKYLIKKAQSFTVSFVSCVVSKNFERRRGDDNDILILTRTQVGTRPKLERVHFWEKDIPDKVTIDDIWAETVLLVEDYNGDDVIVIEWTVIEVDTDDGARERTKNSLLALVGSFGSAFPALIPYGAASRAVINLVEKIISRVKRNEFIIESRFSLRSGEGRGGSLVGPSSRVGRKFLQAGTYVMFEKEVYGQKYKLNPDDARVRDKDGRDPDESYVVFEVVPTKEISNTELVGEKIATLMTQIRDKESTSSGDFAINFLQDTLDAYTTQKKLQRYLGLSQMDRRTEAEDERFQQLSNDEKLKELLQLFQLLP